MDPVTITATVLCVLLNIVVGILGLPLIAVAIALPLIKGIAITAFIIGGVTLVGFAIITILRQQGQLQKQPTAEQMKKIEEEVEKLKKAKHIAQLDLNS